MFGLGINKEIKKQMDELEKRVEALELKFKESSTEERQGQGNDISYNQIVDEWMNGAKK